MAKYFPPDCSRISSSKSMFEMSFTFSLPVPFIYEICHFVGNIPRCSCMRPLYLSRINHIEEQKTTTEGSSQKNKKCSNWKVVMLLSKKEFTLTIVDVIFPLTEVRKTFAFPILEAKQIE